MAHDVFVSYSSKDKTIADAIVAALENNQIRCWYAPRDIKPSEDWGNAITSAVESCKVFLMIFSGNANHSQRVLDELNYAISQQTVILPFRVENLEPIGAMKLHLASRHWLDAYDPSWHSHIKKLVKAVSDNLQKAIEEQQIVMPAGMEKKSAQQQKQLTRILAGVALGAAIITAGWFGWSSLNPAGRNAAASPAVETSTPQESIVTEEAEATETTTPATPELTAEPTLPDSTAELGPTDYETDFATFGMEGGAWPVGKQDADGNVYTGSDGTLVVQNIHSLLYDGNKKYINSIMEVDAKFISFDRSEMGINLLCRIINLPGKSGEVGYYADFEQSGEVSIYISDTGIERTIASGKVPRFVMDKFYRLRFDCVGSDFKVYVNGLLIAGGSDRTYYSGALGLATGQLRWGEVTAVFDNFKLWLP